MFQEGTRGSGSLHHEEWVAGGGEGGGMGEGRRGEGGRGKRGSRGLQIGTWQPCTNSDMFSFLPTT